MQAVQVVRRRPFTRMLVLLACFCLHGSQAAQAQQEAIATDQPGLALPDLAAPLNQSRGAPATGSPGAGPSSSAASDLVGPGAANNAAIAQDFDQLAQQLAESNFSQSLDRTFAMIGDFFGRGATSVTVGDFVGIAVHHQLGSGSAFADDDIHLVTTTSGSDVVFVGGPGGLVPGSFLTPSIASLGSVETGFGLNGGVPGSYTAVETPDVVDVYDDVNDLAPSIPGATVYNIYQAYTLLLPGPHVADIVGRARVQDNNSSLPRDRVYFDYNYFHNVPLTSRGTDVNRFVPGFEKTAWDGIASLEVRVPMAVTFAASQTVDVPFETSSWEIGDMMLAPKILLTSTDHFALAAGLGITLPTGRDIGIANSSGDRLLNIDTHSVHLIPYVALLYAPERSSFFTQVFVTADVDTNGNPVLARLNGTDLEQIGIWNDQTLLALSGSVGQFVYQSSNSSDSLQSLAYSVEMHYTDTVSDADTVNSGAFMIGDPSTDISLLNATIGGHARFRNSTATIGYSVPLTSSDRLFDGEVRCFINRFF